MCCFSFSFFLYAFRCPHREKWHNNSNLTGSIFDEIKQEIVILEKCFWLGKISYISHILMLDICFYIWELECRGSIRKFEKFYISFPDSLRISHDQRIGKVLELWMCDKRFHKCTILIKYNFAILSIHSLSGAPCQRHRMFF